MPRIIKICVPIVIVLCMVLSSISAYAKTITVEADGYALLGSGDSLEVGYERAKHDAMRNAADKAGVYVSSYAVVENGVLTKDEIEIMSATVMKVLEIENTPEVLGGKGIQLKSHIKATINTDDMEMAAYKRNALIEKEKELKKIKAEYANYKQETSKNKLSSLDEKYMTTMLEQVIITNDTEQIVKAAETVIKLFPDNEVARIALLRYNLDNQNKEYIENYLKKYPDDIYGQYAYLQVNSAEISEYTPLIEKARTIISEEEFYSIVKPFVMVDLVNFYNCFYYSKAYFLHDMFCFCEGFCINTDYISNIISAIAYVLPSYKKGNDTCVKIMNDYMKKYPPSYFFTKRDLEKFSNGIEN